MGTHESFWIIALSRADEHPDPNWKSKKIAEAELWKDKVPSAKYVLALANG